MKFEFRIQVKESKCELHLYFSVSPEKRELSVFLVYIYQNDFHFSDLFIRSVIVVCSSFVICSHIYVISTVWILLFLFVALHLFIDDITVDVFVIVHYSRSSTLCTRSFIAPAEMLNASHF